MSLFFCPIQEELDFDRCLFASAGNIRILSLFHLLADKKKKNFDRCLFFSYCEPLNTESFFCPIQEELDFDRCLFASAGNIRILSLFHLQADKKKWNFDRCLFFSYCEPLNTESFFLSNSRRVGF